MELEGQLLKAPLESIAQNQRNLTRNSEKDLNFVMNGVQEIYNRVNRGKLSKEDAEKTIDKLINRVNGLKRKVKENEEFEKTHFVKCKARIEHLKGIETLPLTEIDQPTQKRFHRTKCDRILLDYLFRGGYQEAALELSKDIPNGLTDIEIFSNVQRYIQSLEKHSLTESLQWAVENRSRLKKIGSELEFMIRVQEYIELIRKKDQTGAFNYAKKIFPTFYESSPERIQELMGLLVVDPQHPNIEKYSDLLSESRWTELISNFKFDFFTLHGLRPSPLLYSHLVSGLVTLKTHSCHKDSQTTQTHCPTCRPKFFEMSEGLIPVEHSVTKLVCWISGKVMDDENIPMVLPNGNVYSKDALSEMAQRNQNVILDPRTNEKFDFSELKKIFIV